MNLGREFPLLDIFSLHLLAFFFSFIAPILKIKQINLAGFKDASFEVLFFPFKYLEWET